MNLTLSWPKHHLDVDEGASLLNKLRDCLTPPPLRGRPVRSTSRLLPTCAFYNSGLGPFIIDFVCHERRLIIEVDGGQHAENVRHDAERDAWLMSKGYRILRFWNFDVLRNTEGVLQAIANVIDEDLPPSLTLPLKGGGDKVIASTHTDNSSTAPIPNLTPRAGAQQTAKP